MYDLLIETGLTDLQAAVYVFLLEHGESSPPLLAKSLQMTRTNAYKVLDSLQELQLVTRHDRHKKFAYQAADPSALANLVAEKRNDVIALEHNVREAMQQLRKLHRKSSAAAKVSSRQGVEAMIEAYEQQAELGETIYFVKSCDDIPFMGYETMRRIRHLPGERGTERFGITPDSSGAVLNPAIDKRSRLTRTWLDSERYTAPVEWTVSGDELLIQVFAEAGRVIRIQDAAVADAFQQLWRLTDTALRHDPGYARLPKRAKREV